MLKILYWIATGLFDTGEAFEQKSCFCSQKSIFLENKFSSHHSVVKNSLDKQTNKN